MNTKLKQKQLYVAVTEHQLAVDAFAQSMLDADPGFIVRMFDADVDMLTPNMEKAFARFVIACRRLKELREEN